MALVIELTKEDHSRFFDRRVFVVDEQENILEVGIAKRETGGATKYKMFFKGKSFEVYTTDRRLNALGPLRSNSKVFQKILDSFEGE